MYLDVFVLSMGKFDWIKPFPGRAVIGWMLNVGGVQLFGIVVIDTLQVLEEDGKGYNCSQVFIRPCVDYAYLLSQELM